MYIQLTKFDNTPIWINAAFIVTIEPRKQGGSVVVPIGDGLDYDVRENPEKVLAMLEGAPAAAVVPIPVSDALTAAPEDVSAEPSVMTAEDVVEPKEEPLPKPHKRVAKSRAKAEAKPETADGTATPGADAPKTRTTRTRAKKAEPAVLSGEQIERLRKMAPGSLKKLANTLASQFKVADAEGAIKSLADGGVLSVDHDHVTWK